MCLKIEPGSFHYYKTGTLRPHTHCFSSHKKSAPLACGDAPSLKKNSGIILPYLCFDTCTRSFKKIYIYIFSGSCAQYLIINETGFISTAPGMNLDRESEEISKVRGVCFIKIEVSFIFVIINLLSKFHTSLTSFVI